MSCLAAPLGTGLGDLRGGKQGDECIKCVIRYLGLIGSWRLHVLQHTQTTVCVAAAIRCLFQYVQFKETNQFCVSYCGLVSGQDPYIIGALGTSYIQAIQAYRGPGQAVSRRVMYCIWVDSACDMCPILPVTPGLIFLFYQCSPFSYVVQ